MQRTLLHQAVEDPGLDLWAVTAPDGQCWVLNRRGHLYRWDGGAFHLGCDDTGLELSRATACCVFWSADSLWVARLLGHGGEGVDLYEWEGGAFHARSTEGAAASTGDDRLVFDSLRGELVHLQARGRLPGDLSGVQAFRLTSGCWHPDAVAPDLGSVQISAGDAPHLGVVVLLDSDGQCAVLTEAGWSEQPRGPGCWAPGQWIREGEVLWYVHRERSTTPRLRVWTLSDGSWTRHPCEAPAGRSGAPDLQALLPTSPPTLLGFRPPKQAEAIARAGLRAHGQVLPPDWGIAGGGGAVLAQERSPAAPTMRTRVGIARWRAGAWEYLPSTEGGLLYVWTDAERLLRLRHDGAILRLDGEVWRQVSAGPEGFGSRDESAVAWDATGRRLFVVGGRPDSGRMSGVLHEFTESDGWRERRTRGKKPALAGAVMGWDAGRSVLVVLGGRSASGKRSEVAYELDGSRWTASSGGSVSAFRRPTLTWDPASGHLVLADGCRFWHYLGEGVRVPIHQGSPTEAGTFCPELGALTLGKAGLRVGRLEPDLAPVVPSSIPEPALPEAPDVRYLKNTDGEENAFWFIARDGATLHLRWGDRGTEGEREVVALESAGAATAALARRVEAQIERGYWDAPEGEDAAQVPGRVALHWRWGAGPARVGGAVAGAPTCADCGEAMLHLASWPGRSDLPIDRGAVTAFVCANPDGTCETWEAFGGASQVRVVDSLPEPVGSDGFTVASLAYEEAFEPDPSSDDAIELGIRDKCGGYPTWLQGEATPACRQCGEAMAFFAQFSEFDPQLNLGGDGVAYVFVGPSRHDGALLWQSG